jgi:UPF0755 protein
MIAASFVGYRYYQQQLEPVSTVEASRAITIKSGANVQQVARDLEQIGLIKSSWALEVYMRQNNLRSSLRSGTYSLSPHMSARQIAAIITSELALDRWVIIAPERRLDQIRDDLINDAGFTADEVDSALDPALYIDHPALIDRPAGASLEGYLYPETFKADANTTPQQIIELSLDEMAANLTPEIRSGIQAQGLTVHEGIILASIVEREVESTNPADRPQVAQVFYTRLEQGIKLQSNATTLYGAILSGDDDQFSDLGGEVSYPTAYNTYQNEGLPPSPISNVSVSSLEAVASPASTDYLYFVSGDDCLPGSGQATCTNYFARTYEEHQRNVSQYCQLRCSSAGY